MADRIHSKYETIYRERERERERRVDVKIRILPYVIFLATVCVCVPASDLTPISLRYDAYVVTFSRTKGNVC